MLEIVSAIAVATIVPLGGWVLSIQSKVSAHEIQLEAQKELLLSKLGDIAGRLGRIERALNGHLAALGDEDERYH